MDWLAKINEPFFLTQGEAQVYVARELDQAVPEGWAIETFADQPLTWIIKKKKLEPGEWPDKDYSVRVSQGLDFVILTYGNNDAGIGLHHTLHSAFVIEPIMLRLFGLGQCLSFVFANLKPNEWGYT